MVKPLHGSSSSDRRSGGGGTRTVALTLVAFFNVASVIFNAWISLRRVSDLQIEDAARATGKEAAFHAPPPPPITGADASIAAKGERAGVSPFHSSSPYGMVLPEGRAVALPSVLATSDEEANIDRKFYGGKGDKAHLGGFTSFDPMGVSPTLWTHMVNHLGIKSLLDVGCGRGISTSWFILHGLEYVGCAEGSHDAVTQSIIPKIPKQNIPNGTRYEIVEHDFSRGPWWPERTVDVVWCVEFTEHVGRNYQPNYLTAFRKAGIIFMTHSLWGGWHHVEVHDKEWWIIKMESQGFIYSKLLTDEMHQIAQKDRYRTDLVKAMEGQGDKTFNVAQHLWGTLLVFINPLVVSQLEHAHLFAEHGCNSPTKGRPQECGKAGIGDGVSNLTPLPERFKPLPITKEMDVAWMNLIRDIPVQ